MPISRKALCVAYGLIALLALVGTWGNNVAYVGLGFVETNITFWRETLVNPASRSITVDLFFLGLAMFVWMVLEARRLGMRRVWLYLLFGMLVAISVTVPIFLINRERALATREPASAAGTLSVPDIAGLVLVTAAICGYTAITLST
jgi:Terpene cyclase DEP1